MTAPTNQGELAKLVQTWNKSSDKDHHSLSSVPTYHGISLSYNCDEWRRNHPQDFPQFCKEEKTDGVSVYDTYECGSFSLPPRIVGMYLEREVDFATLEAFITLLIQTKDKKKKLPLKISQARTNGSGGKDSPRAEPIA